MISDKVKREHFPFHFARLAKLWLQQPDQDSVRKDAYSKPGSFMDIGGKNSK